MKYFFSLCAAFCALTTLTWAQCDDADHTVTASSFMYSPSDLVIEAGESVAFVNTDGFHDVNGENNSITNEPFNNPVDFSLAAQMGEASGICLGVVTFDEPGVYNYDCSIGSHAELGMVGTITVNAPPQPSTVVDIIAASEDHTVLETAVVTAGLVEALSGEGPFTVFAPTDAAFTALLEALSVTADDLLALNELTQVLTYHVAGVNALSTDLTDGQMVTTLNGQDVTIGIADNVVSINGSATVTIADLIAENGVVHVIDAVLVPATITGCTNMMACNYSLVANEDDDSCVVIGDSCDDGDDATENDVIGDDCECAGEIVETTTVVDIIVESEDHTVLETAVVTAGLVEALSGEGPFTVFAPTDAAFTALLEALSVTADDLLALNELTQVLTYHVAGVNALSTDLTDGQMVTTLNGQDVTIGIANDTITVNGTATVTIEDLIADNGVVHVIDAVLIPDTITGCTNMMACNYSFVANEDDDSCVFPGDSCDDGDDATENDVIGDDCECAGEIVETTTVVDIIVESEDHTVLETAVVTAGLVEALSGEGPFTVFAPTDAAFTALLEALSVTADDLLALNELTQVLTYHVAGVNALSTDLTDGQMVTTLNGQDVTIGIADNVVSINGTATVTIADLIADNGVVHVIDAVLVPATITGCTNMMACNYSLVANEDDDSCEVPGDACDDGDEATENDVIGDDCECEGEVVSNINEATMTWTVAPNPAKDFIALTGLTPMAQVVMLDLTGRNVREFAQGTNLLSVGDMSPGTYLLMVTEGGEMSTQKIVLQ